MMAARVAGVPIDLIVRGMCSLQPGVPGFSESIQVRSIVGRYLEHSRIYRFGPSVAERVYLIGSADLMSRNLHRRVEACVAVDDPSLTRRLDEILESALRDDVLAWELHPDGTWTRVPGATDHEHHAYLQAAAQRRAPGVVVGNRSVQDVPRLLSTGIRTCVAELCETSE